MNEQAIRQLAAQILADIAPEADLGTLDDSQDLREALDLDSMDFLNFVIGLSEKSGMPIPEADMAKVRTMAGLIAYLRR
jgi:acyl carrier protein